MDFEEAFQALDQIVSVRLQLHLNNVQKVVLRGAWAGYTYEAIADTSNYTSKYLKQDVGPKLWKLLSDALDEPINKGNCRTVMERRCLAPLGLAAGRHRSQPLMTPLRLNSVMMEQAREPMCDWGSSPDVIGFMGRESVLATLHEWVDQSCRLIAMVGMGKIGKTFVAKRCAEQVQHQFDFVIWRSLRYRPPLSELLDDILTGLHASDPPLNGAGLTHRLARLLQSLNQHRCLIVLDQFEVVFEPGRHIGHYRSDCADYRELLRQIGEGTHQSCVMVTSREQPRECAGASARIRDISIPEFSLTESQQLLQDIGQVSGTEGEWAEFVRRYGGNPFMLTTMADLIQNFYGRYLTDVLIQRIVLPQPIRDVLDEQFHRLSDAEKDVMYWLAIAHEAVSLSELQADFLYPTAPTDIMDSLTSLLGRGLIKQARPKTVGLSTNGTTGFEPLPLIRAYVLNHLIVRIIEEIRTGSFNLLMSHALVKAQAQDYVREQQVLQVLHPIAETLFPPHTPRAEIEACLNQRLRQMGDRFRQVRGYGVGNLLNLCQHLRIDLAGQNLANLVIWQADLRDADLNDVDFSGSDLSKSVFANTLGEHPVATFSPSGHHLATGDMAGDISVWNVADGQPLLRLNGFKHRVRSLAFSPDGDFLASGGDDAIIRLWTVRSGECHTLLSGHRERVNRVCFSADGNFLASASHDQTLRVWDIRGGQCVQTFEGHGDRVQVVAFSPDGSRLLSGSDDQTVRLWHVATGNCLQEFHGTLINWAWAVIFASEPGSPSMAPVPLAANGDEHVVRLWNVETQCYCGELEGHDGSVLVVEFSADGRRLASSDEQMVRIWDLQTGTCLRAIYNPKSRVSSLAFSPQAHVLATGHDDRTVRLWNIATGDCLRTFQGQKHRVWSFAFSAPSMTERLHQQSGATAGDRPLEGGSIQRFATGGDDQAIRLWDTATGRFLAVWRGHRDWVSDLAFSPNGQLLASGSYDTTVKLWDVNTGTCLATFGEHSGAVKAIAFSPDGRLLASASDDQTVCLWDIQAHTLRQLLPDLGDRISTLCFSPDTQRLAIGGDRLVALWTLGSDHLLTLTRQSQQVNQMCFSLDGQTLASASEDGEVKLWQIDTGTCNATYALPLSPLHALTIGLDGQLQAWGVADSALQQWDVQTGQCVQRIAESSDSVHKIKFCPSGHRMASGGNDAPIKFWRVATGDLLRTLRVDSPYGGMNITAVRGLTLAQREMLEQLGAIEQ